MNLRNFFDELNRRHVVRATVGYCVGAWIAIQVTDTVAPLLGLSEDIPRVVAISAIALLPVAVLLAWFYDFTRSGVRRTQQVDAGTAAMLPRNRVVTQALGFIAIGVNWQGRATYATFGAGSAAASAKPTASRGVGSSDGSLREIQASPSPSI